MKRVLMVLAGGSGLRMGSGIPKQFLEIEGKAILQISMEKFIAAVPDIRIVAVLPPDHIEYWKHYCRTRNFIYPQTLAEGGITRFHSVRNGLKKIREDCLVAVHDGVRPLVSSGLVSRLFDLAETYGAVVPVIPSVDTVKLLSDENEGHVLKRIQDKNIGRKYVYGAQTPQIFSSGILRSSYETAYDTDFTDDASVVEKCGFDIHYTEGERTNIKVTVPEDLPMAEYIAMRQIERH